MGTGVSSMATGDRSTNARRASTSRTAGASARTARQPAAKSGGQKRTRPRASAATASTQRARVTERAGGQQAARARTPDSQGGLLSWEAVTLPVVHSQVPVLRVNTAAAAPVVAQAKWAAQALLSNLPPRDRLLYYGGLGLAATVGVLEWPVAAAAGAGVWIASRGRERRAA
jgi:hypothetical protein